MLTGSVRFALSPAVAIEYEAVLHRPGILGETPWIEKRELAVVLDSLCSMCVPALPWFRFRPFLADPKDDIYIECALAAGARLIVSDDTATSEILRLRPSASTSTVPWISHVRSQPPGRTDDHVSACHSR